MRLSIAIITYERKKLLLRCLESLQNQNVKPFEVIVIDSSKNMLTADEVNSFAQYFPIRYIHIEKRCIIPVARNIAIKESQGTHIAFIDDDATAIDTYTEGIIEGFAMENVGCVGGPTINATAENIPFETILTDNSKRIRILPWGEVRSDARRWVPTKPVWVDGAQGGNMTYPIDLLQEIGGFDEEYEQPSFREESDIQMRIRRKGYRILYHPKTFVWHMPDQKGGISDVENDKSEYFYHAGKNARRFADRYFPRFLSRLSWVLWSRSPASLLFALPLSIIRKQNYFSWHRGLWEKVD